MNKLLRAHGVTFLAQALSTFKDTNRYLPYLANYLLFDNGKIFADVA